MRLLRVLDGGGGPDTDVSIAYFLPHSKSFLPGGFMGARRLWAEKNPLRA